MSTVTVPPASEPALDEPPATKRRDTKAALIMVAPAVLLLLAFVVVPFIAAGWLSLHNVRLNSGRPATWFGLQNYTRLLTDPEFYRGAAEQLHLRRSSSSRCRPAWRWAWRCC